MLQLTFLLLVVLLHFVVEFYGTYRLIVDVLGRNMTKSGRLRNALDLLLIRFPFLLLLHFFGICFLVRRRSNPQRPRKKTARLIAPAGTHKELLRRHALYLDDRLIFNLLVLLLDLLDLEVQLFITQILVAPEEVAYGVDGFNAPVFLVCGFLEVELRLFRQRGHPGLDLFLLPENLLLF